MWNYHNPVNIIFTDVFITELKRIIKNDNSILIICSKRFTKTIEFKQIEENLKDFGLFTEIENEPSFTSCNLAIEFAHKIKPSIILAIGGGSVIDTAKAVRLSLLTNSISIESMLEQKLSYYNKLKFIAVPTTHGTASELTKWATIWDKKEKKKYSLSDDVNYPDDALYDYHFVKNLPLDISLITTLDALSHSFEALWNRNSNPISDEYAIQAIKLIVENIDRLNKNTSIQTRINLLKACLYAGLAFSNTKTAVAHSISYPLTMYYGIPHGIACSITLAGIFKKNASAIEDKSEQILKLVNFNTMNEFWIYIKKVVSKHIKFSLDEYGIKKADLNKIVSSSFNKDRIANNIIILDNNDIKQILLESGKF